LSGEVTALDRFRLR
jgi:hypothetical protein